MLRFTNVDHKPTRLPPVYGYRTHPLLPLRQALDPILSRISELDEFIKTAKNECHFPSEHGLSREESASIYLYTMDWGEQSLYRVLNEALREKDRSVLVPWHGYLKLFNTALQKLPDSHINLWRGINVDISKNFKEGEELTWWSFNSCSSSVKVVKQFLGQISTLLMIEAKNGKLISAYSNFPDENEVILGLGTRLRVVSDALDHPSLNVVHLLELNDESDEELSLPLTAMGITQPVENVVGYKETSTNDKSSTFKVHTYSDSSRYEGEWANGKKQGKGTYYSASGNTYTGDWVDNHRTGQGVFTWSNKDRYEGQFKDDKKNGKGTIYFANGNTYTGDWVDSHRTGQGVFTWSNEDRYEGQYKDDKMNGKGTLQYADGRQFTGHWVDDKKTGEGIVTWPSGDHYEGQFRDDKRNGKGTKHYSCGDKYTGDWIDDNKDGEGIFIWPNGDRYEGQFKNGKMNGMGKKFYANGRTKEGTWSDDQYVA